MIAFDKGVTYIHSAVSHCRRSHSKMTTERKSVNRIADLKKKTPNMCVTFPC
jgi:hypothetical protein